MGTTDTITKKYMSDHQIFADAFNFYLYDGKAVIKPEQLHPLDVTAVEVPYGNNASIPVQKTRDVFRYLTAMADDNTAYLLLGIENQAAVHYAMPVRNMLYDALAYANQVQKAAISYKEHGSNNVSREEYLSGFHREDKLLPVITLVVYFGANSWNAPLSLHEMLAVEDKTLLNYIADYKLQLITPYDLDNNDLQKFSTNLRQVLSFIKYSRDKEQLKTLIQEEQAFSQLDRTAAMVLNSCTNANLQIQEESEVVNVCQAIEDMKEDSRIEGKLEGRMEAQQQERKEFACSLLQKKLFPLEEIAALTKLSLSEVTALQQNM